MTSNVADFNPTISIIALGGIALNSPIKNMMQTKWNESMEACEP